jgi:hypothetical protein
MKTRLDFGGKKLLKSMRLIIPILFHILLLCFASCSKSGSDPEPEPNPKGAYLSCTINGKAFQSTMDNGVAGARLSKAEPPLMQIDAINASTNESIPIAIYGFNLTKPAQVFNFNRSIQSSSTHVAYHQDNKKTWNVGTGTIEVISYKGGWLEGRFNANLTPSPGNPATGTVTITDGKFRLQVIEF